MRLKAAEQRGEAVAPADGHHPRAARQPAHGPQLAHRLGRRALEEPEATPSIQEQGEPRHEAVHGEQERDPVPPFEPAHPQPAQQQRGPQRADTDQDGGEEQDAADGRQHQPAFEPQTRDEPLEGAWHGPLSLW